MSKKSDINYVDVARFCNELLNAGEKITVRKIHSHVGGGSFSTISKYYSQWQAERNFVKGSHAELSEEFRQAVLAEMARTTQKIKNEFDETLAIEKNQLKEAQELLAEYESKMDALNEEILKYQAQIEAQRIDLEKISSITEGRVLEITKNSEKRLSELTQNNHQKQEEIEKIRSKLHQSEVNAAVLQAQNQEQEKQIKRLELELKEAKNAKNK